MTYFSSKKMSFSHNQMFINTQNVANSGLSVRPMTDE